MDREICYKEKYYQIESRERTEALPDFEWINQALQCFLSLIQRRLVSPLPVNYELRELRP